MKNYEKLKELKPELFKQLIKIDKELQYMQYR